MVGYLLVCRLQGLNGSVLSLSVWVWGTAGLVDHALSYWFVLARYWWSGILGIGTVYFVINGRIVYVGGPREDALMGGFDALLCCICGVTFVSGVFIVVQGYLGIIVLC